MALPILAKTYEFSTNNLIASVGDAATEHKQFVLAFKNVLIGFANAPWTVAGSSNTVSAGMDAVDRWLSVNDLVFQSTSFPNASWIVFDLQGGRQLLVYLQAAEGVQVYRNMSMWMSHAGLFTGGAVNARPTATDEVFLSAGASLANLITTENYRWHAIHSTDGQVTHIIANHNGYTQFWLSDVRLQDTDPAWAFPFVLRWQAGGPSVDRMTYAENRAQQIWNASVSSGGASFAGAATCEGFLSNAIGENIIVPNDLDGRWSMTPAGFASTAGVGMGQHGRIPDLWYVSTGLNTGDTLEQSVGAPTRQFAVFGNFALPWDGSVPLVS